VDAALGLGGGHALDAVDARLVLHLGVDLFAFEDGGDVLEAADVGVSLREDFDLPSVLLGEAQIHAKDLGNEERGLVATGAGAKLDDDVLFVVRIFGQEQDFEFFLHGGEARLEIGELRLGHLAQVGVGFGEHGFGVRNGVAEAAVLTELFDGWLEVAVLLGDLAIVLLVVDDAGIAELAGEVFVAGFGLVKAVEHGGLLCERQG
jgi:hypothetical protein